MTKSDLLDLLDFARKKTEETLAAVAARPDPAAVLRFRAGPGRAHIGRQLMHIAATDDRHLNVRMKGGSPRSEEFVRRFAVGSIPDDDVPALTAIRAYLAERRADRPAHLNALSEADLPTKPRPDAPWTYHEWCKVPAWHEAHHHGQMQITLNLYRAVAEPGMAKVGH
jgi:hypothetical protein